LISKNAEYFLILKQKIPLKVSNCYVEIVNKTRNFPDSDDVKFFSYGGGGTTRPLPRDGGVEELHGNPTVGPRPKVCTRGQKCKK